jgi:phage terminase Nu1 subunit (DNA packaging protein)
LDSNVKDLDALKEAAEARLTSRQENVAAMKQDRKIRPTINNREE